MSLYVVTPSPEKLPKDSKTRLIRAHNKNAALSFAVKDFYTAEPASTDDAFKLAKAGVEIEQAGE